jgi:hypothetical protein
LLRLRRLDAFSERGRRAYDSTIGFGLAPRARNFRFAGLRASTTCADSGMLTLYDGDRIT